MAENASLDQEKLSLENCDREPVHIPGHVQPFGVLLATDKSLSTFQWCSENAEAFLSLPLQDILGKRPGQLFSDTALHDIHNALSVSTSRSIRGNVGTVQVGHANFDCWVHVNADGFPVIELEALDYDREDGAVSENLRTIWALLARLQQTEELDSFLKATATALRSITGFDRVMVYRFDSTGDGEVLAEDHTPGLEPFLGLRFPSWDIPQQARAIMAKLPLRVIADVRSEPVWLRGTSETLPPLDMTLAALRGTSKIHIEYLSNMGVAGSMTLSITVQGRLWGLIAFHHRKPRLISAALRNSSEIFAQFFCQQMEQRVAAARSASRAISVTLQKRMLAASGQVNELAGLVKESADAYCKVTGADGLAFMESGNVQLYGSTPPAETVQELSSALFGGSDAAHVVCVSFKDRLPDLAGPLGASAGGIALKIGSQGASCLLVFRDEVARSVTWAGQPDKTVDDTETGPRLRPRGTFAAYVQSAAGRCRPWEEMDVEAALSAQETLSQLDDALHRHLGQKVERQRNIYIAELNHRVRNILALIRSISRRAQESASSLESYAKALEERIAALGAAHDLATNRIATGINLYDLFRTEIKPFQTSGNPRLYFNGDSFAIRADLAPMLALVIHELTTNSAKYGALSVSDGKILVSFRADRGGVEVEWKEEGGPPTTAPNRVGFGLGLIERAIPYEMDGDARLSFKDDGLLATFWFPEQAVSELGEEDLPLLAMPQKRQRAAIVPKKVLVLEDSMVVAMDLADTLEKMGVSEIKLSSNIQEAERYLDIEAPDLAILDITLRTDTSYEIARRLRAEGIPFLFATGYGSDHKIPKDLGNALVMTKPVDPGNLSNQIIHLYKK